MTGYLRAAYVCRTLAVLAVAVTVWLSVNGPWWAAALTGWAAFLGIVLGGLFHLAHYRTITDQKPLTRRKETPAA